jgi:RNA ligase
VDIWECLRDKTNFNDFLDRVPDEFDIKVKNYVEKLETDFFIFNENVHLLFEDFKDKRLGFPFDNTGRKEYAMWVKEQPREYQSILFSLYDGRDYSDIIWKIIKPKYDRNW